MTGTVSIYVAVENEDVAVHMATALVKEKLAACANIVEGVRSIYEWDGLIQLDKEVILFLKTTEEKQQAATQKIREMHNYQVPCIVVTPIIDGDKDYLSWVKEQVTLKKSAD